MGACSTIKITRSKARNSLISTIIACSDDKLQELMDNVLSSMLYNCIIVDDTDEDNQDCLI